MHTLLLCSVSAAPASFMPSQEPHFVRCLHSLLSHPQWPLPGTLATPVSYKLTHQPGLNTHTHTATDLGHSLATQLYPHLACSGAVCGLDALPGAPKGPLLGPGPVASWPGCRGAAAPALAKQCSRKVRFSVASSLKQLQHIPKVLISWARQRLAVENSHRHSSH